MHGKRYTYYLNVRGRAMSKGGITEFGSKLDSGSSASHLSCPHKFTLRPMRMQLYRDHHAYHAYIELLHQSPAVWGSSRCDAVVEFLAHKQSSRSPQQPTKPIGKGRFRVIARFTVELSSRLIVFQDV